MANFRDSATRSHHSFLLYLIICIVRFLQFVLGVAVVGLYGNEINTEHSHNEQTSAYSTYIYGAVVAGLSAITALLWIIPCIPAHFSWGWDLVLFILWAVLFGIEGKTWINTPTNNDDDTRLKNTTWLDLVNMLLWFITAVYGLVQFFVFRSHRRSLHTGRATV